MSLTPPPPFSIRPYTTADAAACTGVFSRAWHAGHPYQPRSIGLREFTAETRGERLLVAEAGGEVVGFVALHLQTRFIHHLYVEPALFRHGIGAALLRAAVALAGGHASLKCQTRNAESMAFYARMGWTKGESGTSPEVGPWVRWVSPGVAVADAAPVPLRGASAAAQP
jgi:GNAT superfamily N-acetyltransferase